MTRIREEEFGKLYCAFKYNNVVTIAYGTTFVSFDVILNEFFTHLRKKN